MNIKLLSSLTSMLLFAVVLLAQPNENIATLAEQMPYFQGCINLENGTSEKRMCSNQTLVDFIGKNIQYPEAARDQGIEGTVLVKFVVNQMGKIEQSEVLRDIGGDCGKEALRIVELMPDWEPAMNEDKAVSVRLNLPVTFSLQNEEELVSSKYQIQWGKLRGPRVSKEELKNHLSKKIFVRDEMGEEVDISSLSFIFQKKRAFYEETSTGRVTKKMERLIKKKVKKGGDFVIVATIQKEGKIYEIEREFKVVQ